jgi:GTP cyclohydrolase I
VRVETLVFDLKQNKLVWAGQSETTNPDRLDQFMRDLVKAVGDDMRRKGVIAAPAS